MKRWQAINNSCLQYVLFVIRQSADQQIKLTTAGIIDVTVPARYLALELRLEETFLI